MRPDDREIDEEIRGHLALSVKERIDGGEDPEAARLAALREFGYVPAARESMRRIWHSRWLDALAALADDIRIGMRSLRRAPGLALTVVITLALGIGANAAIFGVVRGVLLRPLVNRDEDRLLYIRQSAPGAGVENVNFSIPEYKELKARATTISAFGDFSTVQFTLMGLGGEPRLIRAGVVGGSFFDVMGLRPVLGRLLNDRDDGPKAAGAAVLTYRFWTTALASDPTVVGRSIRLGPSPATVVGVLEPSVPYPADTEIFANVVTSPHHLDVVMNEDRTHRMTEIFGRLAPGKSIEDARAELTTAHAAIVQAHPAAYAPGARVQLTVKRLRDQIAAPARTILLVLLATAALVFVIACSNVANLILARSVRREGELAVRAALGASRGALRRTLLAESLVLCGAGAVLGVLIARPFVSLVARYATRFSVRALDLTVDASVVWAGAALAMAAAVLLAYVPRLPAAGPATAGSGRVTSGANRRLRVFATAQIAFSFVLLAGAGMLLATLVSLQRAATSYDMRHVLVFDLPPLATGVVGPKAVDFYQETIRRVGELPGVQAAAVGSNVPWRDAGQLEPMPFTAVGYTATAGEATPRGRLRLVTPGFFDVLGIPLLAGRIFTEDDRPDGERVVIVSQSVAHRLFPSGDALNRRFIWLEPYFGKRQFRIVGVVGDVDDEHVEPGLAMTIYHPVKQIGYGGRLFVLAAADPYALVPPVTKTIHTLSPDQPVERAATLEDVRAQVLAPERVDAFVFAGFAGIALLIAVVGVAGVLAFSVSARTREFGVRLAVGASPARLLARVLSEGAAIAAFGIAAGAAGGYLLAQIASRVFDRVELPGMLPVTAAAAVMVAAAIAASMMPAARASRVDVLRALRSE